MLMAPLLGLWACRLCKAAQEDSWELQEGSEVGSPQTTQLPSATAWEQAAGLWTDLPQGRYTASQHSTALQCCVLPSGSS